MRVRFVLVLTLILATCGVSRASDLALTGAKISPSPTKSCDCRSLSVNEIGRNRAFTYGIVSTSPVRDFEPAALAHFPGSLLPFTSTLAGARDGNRSGEITVTFTVPGMRHRTHVIRW